VFRFSQGEAVIPFHGVMIGFRLGHSGDGLVPKLVRCQFVIEAFVYQTLFDYSISWLFNTQIKWIIDYFYSFFGTPLIQRCFPRPFCDVT